MDAVTEAQGFITGNLLSDAAEWPPTLSAESIELDRGARIMQALLDLLVPRQCNVVVGMPMRDHCACGHQVAAHEYPSTICTFCRPTTTEEPW